MSSRKGVDDSSHAVKKFGRGRPWVQPNPPPKAWGQPDTAHRLGIRSYNASNGNWSMKDGSSQLKEEEEEEVDEKEKEHNDSEDDEVYSDDDDYLVNDDSDSDEGPPSHESMKNHKMLKGFFKKIDALTVEEINKPEREWHCPACHDGPGAITWYKGLQPLMAHARTKGSQRVKLHRTFADILDEELRIRGTSVVPAGESYAQWVGLKQEVEDHDIVWPPMVMIMNTLLDTDDNDMWIGMGNQELLDYCKGYAAVKAKHSYGPKGHRGISVLIFESSATGFDEAERLHRHFQRQGTGRSEWNNSRKALFCAGGKRQLYGFLARKDDLDEFDKHSQGKARLKYEIRSYHDMVVVPKKQMSEDIQQLTWLKKKSALYQRENKAKEEMINILREKCLNFLNDYQIMRERINELHGDNKEEMIFQEQFFNDQIQKIHEATNVKEDQFEKLQEEQMKIENFEKVPSIIEDGRHRAEEETKFKEIPNQEVEKYLIEREQLKQIHNGKNIEMDKRYREEKLELKREYDAALTELKNKYASRPTEDDVGAGAGAIA
ncbi:protein SUPPRESSOR OF GENE SILENCING 3 homolog [Chenopodium quinoa]|uniref:Suppressor of gene silencing 3 n=1 Tax=Chenopodium quinoa TaxID=63459 RepID=A0A803L531_CHEQI|nr:protein SUPPRESSOR OF GENE SILENCING 3 homolog [Chenopodium quinoa]